LLPCRRWLYAAVRSLACLVQDVSGPVLLLTSAGVAGEALEFRIDFLRASSASCLVVLRRIASAISASPFEFSVSLSLASLASFLACLTIWALASLAALSDLFAVCSTFLAGIFTQNAYFFFQVVQVFLVVTLGSAASSVAEQLAHNPSSITSLLARKLPLASNFYISYFILQGLTISSGVVSQVIGFFIFSLLYRFVAKTPRSIYTRCTSLSAIAWGSVVPVFSNIAVIGKPYFLTYPFGI
jgi:hypothetical protein